MSYDLYQTGDREFPIGMPPGNNSDHNVNEVVQPTIPVQAAIDRLKITAMEPNHQYTDADGEHALEYRWRTKSPSFKVVKTNKADTRLVVTQSGGDFMVFVLINGTPEGYVRFEARFAVPTRWQRRIWTPHSYLRPALRSQGIAISIYRWFVDSGHNLLCSVEHSPGASRLWARLLQLYPHQWLYHDRGSPYGFRLAESDDKTDNTTVLLSSSDTVLQNLLKGMTR